MSILDLRQSQFLDLIRRHGPLSRRDLHERVALRPNTVGEIVGELIDQGLLREGTPLAGGFGRPRLPLELDGSRRHVLGLALEPGRVSSCRLNLLGRVSRKAKTREVSGTDELISAATALIAEVAAEQPLVIGISVTGFVDPQTHSILTSSTTGRISPTPIEALYAAAKDRPIVLENDMHATAAHWLLNQDAPPNDDVLLVSLDDGAVGAAMLINGKPNRGCIIGGNELGHTRFPVDTEKCYCGHHGCLERICSTVYLRKLSGSRKADLNQRVSHFDASDEAMETIIRHLGMGIANVVNFIRPNRLILAGRLAASLPFSNNLLDRVRSFLLKPIMERIRIDPWGKTPLLPAEAAGWLALATIFRHDWMSAPAENNGSRNAVEMSSRRNGK